ncbi:MAG: hypothetical protein AAFP02_20950, partial [Bacteroidota bacterium]
WNGVSEYVADESRTYLQVVAVDGARGWVHEYLFVKGIGLGVVLQGGFVYKRPQTPTTVTTKQFMPGELVIVEGYTGNWVGLAGKKKSKKGWIEGRNKVSIEDQDVLLASLLMSVQAEKDPQKRDKQIALVYEQANQVGSPVAEVIRYGSSQTTSVESTNQQVPSNQQSFSNRTPIASAEPQLSRSIPSRERPMPTVSESNPNLYTRTFKDQNTGQIKQETIETGSIHLLEGRRKEKTIYYAYHKSLPIGSSVQIQIPNTTGIIMLKITNRLPANSPAMLGLHPDCVQAIFGDYIPQEINIIHPQP